MIISNSLKFIFFHVPKSAGTSITRILDNQLAWNDIILGASEHGELFAEYWSPRFNLRKHSQPMEVSRIIGDEVYRAFKKFIVVREPIARTISAYRFIKGQIDSKASWLVNSNEFARIDNVRSFDEFISSEYFNEAFALDPMETHDIQRCFLPQSNYFDAVEHQAGRFDYFKLEDLVISMESLRKCGYLIKESNLERVNRSTQYPVEVSVDCRKLLLNLLRSDFDNFNYEIHCDTLEERHLCPNSFTIYLDTDTRPEVEIALEQDHGTVYVQAGLPKGMQPGEVLSHEHFEALRVNLLRQQSYLKALYKRKYELSESISALTLERSQLRQRMYLPLFGYAKLLSADSTQHLDGWLGDHLNIDLKLYRPVVAVVLSGWRPDSAVNKLQIRMSCGDESIVEQCEGGSFSLELRLSVPRRDLMYVRINSQTQKASAPDVREISFILDHIEMVHEGP